mgnify:CR=1 FL=1
MICLIRMLTNDIFSGDAHIGGPYVGCRPGRLGGLCCFCYCFVNGKDVYGAKIAHKNEPCK